MYRAYNAAKRIIITIISSILNFIKFSFWGVKYSNFPKTRGVVHVISHRRNSIVLGNSVVINSGKHRNPVGAGGVQTVFNATGDGRILIGNNVSMSNTTLVSKMEIKIGDGVMIGNGVTIYDTDFHSIQYSDRISKNDPSIISKKVEIKEGAFIGAGSIILKGVTIGRYSIVGAGSVVTKNIPDNEIWAGNPARFIRRLDQ